MYGSCLGVMLMMSVLFIQFFFWLAVLVGQKFRSAYSFESYAFVLNGAVILSWNTSMNIG
jgi:hypothetical protein